MRGGDAPVTKEKKPDAVRFRNTNEDRAEKRPPENGGDRLKNKLDSLFFKREFVSERHKFP